MSRSQSNEYQRSTSDRTVTRLITDLSYECEAGLQGFPYLRLDNSFLQVAITILQTVQRNGVLNSLLTTLTQFLGRFGGRRRLTIY